MFGLLVELKSVSLVLIVHCTSHFWEHKGKAFHVISLGASSAPMSPSIGLSAQSSELLAIIRTCNFNAI